MPDGGRAAEADPGPGERSRARIVARPPVGDDRRHRGPVDRPTRGRHRRGEEQRLCAVRFQGGAPAGDRPRRPRAASSPRSSTPALDATERGRERLLALCEGYLSYVERRVFPGGCFFVAAAAEVGARPGRVHDEVARIQQQWRDLLEAEAGVAVGKGELPSGTDPGQIAFELGVILAGTNIVSVLHDDQAVVEAVRARRWRVDCSARWSWPPAVRVGRGGSGGRWEVGQAPALSPNSLHTESSIASGSKGPLSASPVRRRSWPSVAVSSSSSRRAPEYGVSGGGSWASIPPSRTRAVGVPSENHRASWTP